MEFRRKELSEKKIHFWYCDFAENIDALESYYSLLSSDEKERSRKFKFDKDSNCYIISRGILRFLTGIYLNMNPKNIKFKYTSFGKPLLDFETDLKFNISHSGNMAVFAFFKNQEIGVDIEKIKNDFNVMELAQNFFSKTEIEALERVPKKELSRAFYRCWTRKESFIKAEGTGLSFPLNQFSVSLEDDKHAELLETKWNSKEKKEWQLFSFIPTIGYIAAVALKNSLATISYHNWDSIKPTFKILQ